MTGWFSVNKEIVEVREEGVFVGVKFFMGVEDGWRSWWVEVGIVEGGGGMMFVGELGF